MNQEEYKHKSIITAAQQTSSMLPLENADKKRSFSIAVLISTVGVFTLCILGGLTFGGVLSVILAKMFNLPSPIFDLFASIQLSAFTPKIDCLTDIIAFYIALLGVAVPLMMSIASQLSERYKSDVITRRVSRSTAARILLAVLFLNVLLLVPFRFFSECDWFLPFWRVSFWFILLMFIIVCIGFGFFAWRILVQFDSSSMIDELFIDANRMLSLGRMTELGTDLEGIGDVMVAELQRKQESRMVEHMRKLRSIARYLALRECESALHQLNAAPSTAKGELFKDVMVSFIPERLTPAFTIALTQFARIFQAAMENNLVDVAYRSTGYARVLLGELAENSDNKIAIRQILSTIRECMNVAIEQTDDRILASCLDWYSEAVMKNDTLTEDLVPLLNAEFEEQFRSLLSSGKNEVCKNIIQRIIGGLHDYPMEEIWEMGHLLMRHNFAMDKMLNEQHHIDSLLSQVADRNRFFGRISEVNKLISEIEHIKSLIYANLSDEKKYEADKLMSAIKTKILGIYRHHQLLDTFFNIGAFCLFKKRTDYIPTIWHSHSPLDSDANWVGTDIIPQNISELIGLFFGKGYIEASFPSFWEGHHGTKIYKEQYFVLLLANMIKRAGTSLSVTLPIGLDIIAVQEIPQWVPTLTEIAQELSTDAELIKALNWNPGLDAVLLHTAVPETLNRLKYSAERESQRYLLESPLSLSKIQSFVEKARELRNTRGQLPNILSQYGRFIDRTNQAMPIEPSLGGDEIQYQRPRGSFLDSWIIGYSNGGTELGLTLALRRESVILNNMTKRCVKRDIAELPNAAITSSSVIFIAWTDIPRLHDCAEIELLGGINRSNEHTLYGNVLLSGRKVPIYPMKNELLKDCFLLVALENFGWFVEFQPATGSEPYQSLDDGLYIGIANDAQPGNVVVSARTLSRFVCRKRNIGYIYALSSATPTFFNSADNSLSESN